MLNKKKKLETAEQKMNQSIPAFLCCMNPLLCVCVRGVCVCVALFSRGQHPLLMTQSLSSGRKLQMWEGVDCQLQKERRKSKRRALQAGGGAALCRGIPGFSTSGGNPQSCFLLSFVLPFTVSLSLCQIYTAEQPNQIFSKSSLKASF